MAKRKKSDAELFLEAHGVDPAQFKTRPVNVKAMSDAVASGAAGQQTGFSVLKESAAGSGTVADMADPRIFQKEYATLLKKASKKLGIPYDGGMPAIDFLETLQVQAEKLNHPAAGILRNNLDLLLNAVEQEGLDEDAAGKILDQLVPTPSLAAKIKVAAKSVDTPDQIVAEVFKVAPSSETSKPATKLDPEDVIPDPIKFPEQPPPLRLVDDGPKPVSFEEAQRRRGLEAVLGQNRASRTKGLQAKAASPSGPSIPPPEVPPAGVTEGVAESPSLLGKVRGGLGSLLGGIVEDEKAILQGAGQSLKAGKYLSAAGKFAGGGLGSLLLGSAISGTGNSLADAVSLATQPTTEAGDIYNAMKAQEIIKRRMQQAFATNPELQGSLAAQLRARQMSQMGRTPNEIQIGGGIQFDDPEGLAAFLGLGG